MRVSLLCLLPVAAMGATSAPAQYVQVTGSSLGDPNIAYPFDDRLTQLHPADSPTVRQRKASQLEVLKQECFRYRTDDGGQISPYHSAVIRRKARDILSSSGRSLSQAKTGSLISKPPKAEQVSGSPC